MSGERIDYEHEQEHEKDEDEERRAHEAELDRCRAVIAAAVREGRLRFYTGPSLHYEF